MRAFAFAEPGKTNPVAIASYAVTGISVFRGRFDSATARLA
jgi:hypothetical protein